MMVADSDVLIDFLRGKGPGAERIEIELKTGRLATTAVNAFELRAGAPSERRSSAVDVLLGGINILPLDDSAAKEAARIHRDLSVAGKSIGMADALIAGICVRHRGTLITRNHKHFGRVSGLILSGASVAEK